MVLSIHYLQSMINYQEVTAKHKELPYRRGVGMIVVNQDRQIFVAQRSDIENDTWQMPQGGMEEDETILEAALRELKEETSITSVEFVSESDNWLYYDVPEFLIPGFWSGKYRGQKQKWLLFKFIGSDTEIDVHNCSDPEFSSWKWTNVDSLIKLIIPFKKQLYESILQEFHEQILIL